MLYVTRELGIGPALLGLILAVSGPMNASVRFLAWGTIPIGALMGGALDGALGLWPTIVAMAGCELLAPLLVLLSPVRTLCAQPAPV